MNSRKCKGFTLIEVVISAVILVIVVFGTFSYQYLAAKQNKIVWAEMAAVRTAQMVIEDWKSTGGEQAGTANGDYDPSYFDSDFIHDTGSIWEITIDSLPMSVALNNQDVAIDAAAGIILRRINVNVKWKTDFSAGTPPANSPSVNLVTYVRADAAGG